MSTINAPNSSQSCVRPQNHLICWSKTYNNNWLCSAPETLKPRNCETLNFGNPDTLSRCPGEILKQHSPAGETFPHKLCRTWPLAPVDRKVWSAGAGVLWNKIIYKMPKPQNLKHSRRSFLRAGVGRKTIFTKHKFLEHTNGRANKQTSKHKCFRGGRQVWAAKRYSPRMSEGPGLWFVSPFTQTQRSQDNRTPAPHPHPHPYIRTNGDVIVLIIWHRLGAGNTTNQTTLTHTTELSECSFKCPVWKMATYSSSSSSSASVGNQDGSQGLSRKLDLSGLPVNCAPHPSSFWCCPG